MKLPYVLHQIWLGGRPMPLRLQQFGEGWRALYPGWEYRLWTERNLPPLINEAAFYAAETPAQQADILRYELLYRFGGIYVDTDFECLRNVEPLLAGVTLFAACEAWNIVSIGILGAVPHHPLFKEAIEFLPASFHSQERVSAQTGPQFFTSIVFNYIARFPGTVHLFDRTFFYPYHWSEPCRQSEQFPWAYAVHHWIGSWTSPASS